MTCADTDTCGRPQVGAGHPRKGWLNIKVAGTAGSTWWCSPGCLIAGLIGVAQRPDVAVCPLCINRHDRDHRCGVCNTQPQVARPAPTPVRLFDHARRQITRKETA